MVRQKLFDNPPTTGQQLVLFLWAANLAVVLLIWVVTSFSLLGTGINGILLSFGRLAGLLAAYFALVQFMLMGRILWLERPFGLDRLAGFHRLNGYATFMALLIHPPLIVASYNIGSEDSLFAQYVSLIRELPYVWMAFISQILFIAVVVSSIYIIRKHLKFETWYWVHLMVYAAIVLAFFHQFAVGGSFLEADWARKYWYGLYAFVAVMVLFYRFSLPSMNLIRHRFKVERVVAESPTTTSVYIQGRNLSRWRAKPGQFVLIRFLNLKFIAEEHPFSLSHMPADDTFRLTIRSSGDYTEKIKSLEPGSYALTSGPFGRFTADVAKTEKRLYLAGGVGITPIRTLAEESVKAGKDSVLLYASRSKDDILLKGEFDGLAAKGLRVIHFVSDAGQGEQQYRNGRIDLAAIQKLVPDYKDRDIYVCGPPAMLDALTTELAADGVDTARLHFERYSLHT